MAREDFQTQVRGDKEDGQTHGVTLIVEDDEKVSYLSADELAERLRGNFATTVIDRARGDAHIQEKLDQLIALKTPEVILTSHRSYFSNVIFVSVSEPAWSGATATSYLYPTHPPLGDGVHFRVEGTDDPALVRLIANELGAALQMIVLKIEKSCSS